MQHFTIRRGARAPADPAPTGPIEDAQGVTSIAILGADWPGLRPKLKVDKGARVVRGDVLFTDRKHHEAFHNSGHRRDVTNLVVLSV
ncbi:MAG: hypothetical protein AAFY31_01970, partial [Pseudomonadota bacterium]